jgi:hypothetical protein
LCTAHILRDLEDARRCYPHAHWPIQIADALRDLIHAANTARDAGRPTIDDQLRDARLEWIRAGVAVGLSEVDRNPDPKGKQRRLTSEAVTRARYRIRAMSSPPPSMASTSLLLCATRFSAPLDTGSHGTRMTPTAIHPE